MSVTACEGWKGGIVREGLVCSGCGIVPWVVRYQAPSSSRLSAVISTHLVVCEIAGCSRPGAVLCHLDDKVQDCSRALDVICHVEVARLAQQ